MNHFVYILECADKTLYCGYTKNIQNRINVHNFSKNGAKYTKSRRPVKLVYFEEFSSLSEALSREAVIKKLSRKEKMELIGFE